MFSFAMITGVKHDAECERSMGRQRGRAGFVVGYVDQNNDCTQVCEGTGKKDDLAYYYARKRGRGIFMGRLP